MRCHSEGGNDGVIGYEVSGVGEANKGWDRDIAVRNQWGGLG